MGSSSDLYKRELCASQVVQTHPDLLRCVPCAEILAGCGAVFRNPPGALVGAHEVVEVGDNDDPKNEDRMITPTRTEEQEKAGDPDFYGRAFQTDGLDYFISHVWGSAWWTKGLSLLFYTNAAVAVNYAIVMWLIMIAYCMWFVNPIPGQFDGLGGLNLLFYLVHLPALSFFFGVVFGHRVSDAFLSARQKVARGWRAAVAACTKLVLRRRGDEEDSSAYFPLAHFAGGQRWWLDKLCIHQTHKETKTLGVTAMPAFVAIANQMVILWSEDYFERLWCCAEVATFTAVKGSTANLVFLPLWLPTWVLCTMLADMLAATLWDRLAWLFPWSASLVQNQFGNHLSTAWGVALGSGLGGALSIGISYLPASVANFLGFRQKVRTHRTMITQMKSFSLLKAKCSVESDRAIVEAHVGRLFLHDEDGGDSNSYRLPEWSTVPEAQKKAAIVAFDEYVRVELLRSVSAHLGHVSDISFPLAMLAFLPLNCESAADILDCDGGKCTESATAQGYGLNPALFMTGNSCDWLVGCTLIFPSTYPLILWLLVWSMDRFEKRPALDIFFSLIAVVGAYFFSGALFGLQCGFMSNAFTKGAEWVLIWLVFIAILLAWNYFLFVVRTRSQTEGASDSVDTSGLRV